MSMKLGNPSSPYDEGAVVVPSDTTQFTVPTRALQVGVAGDITVDFATGGSNVLLKAVPIGVFPFAVTRVYATGTAATNIVRLW